MALTLPGGRTVRTLEDCWDHPGSDNFLLLRFLAAALVIFGHSYALDGKGGGRDVITDFTGIFSGAIGVDIFFIISGFLVAASYVARDDFPGFAKSRFLRIIPGLAVCLLFTVFIVGPVVTSLPLADYFSDGQTWRYLYKNISLGGVTMELPGVFANNAYPVAVNGSLWTLPIEARMYVIIALIGLAGILKRQSWFNVLLLAGVLSSVFLPGLLAEIHSSPHFPRLAAYFMAGSFLFLHRRWIPVHPVPMLVLAMLAAVMHGNDAYPFVFGLFLVAFVFWFAYSDLGLHAFNRVGDYSYGFYIYAWVVQQVVMFLLPDLRALPLFVISSIATLVLAALSWHLVEKPALSLKRMSLRRQHLKLG